MILSPYKISENFVLKKLQFINNGSLILTNYDGKNIFLEIKTVF